MKSLSRKMQELAAVWLLCVLAGTSCAIFYTNSKENDYPRIGKRAFFTMGDKGSSYPRIGRASASSTGTSVSSSNGFHLQPHFGMMADDSSAILAGFGHRHRLPSILKRGIFTGGSSGYPRIGRRSGAEGVSVGQGGDDDDDEEAGLSAAAALTSSLERSEGGDDDDVGEQGMAASPYEVPLGLLFFSFDKNGDKTLSRDEFVQGMARAREDGSACR